MTELVHYAETSREKASRLGKHPSCFSGHTGALCGNGNYHAVVTKDKSKITCEKCLEKLNK